jgi:hypothetical protein
MTIAEGLVWRPARQSTAAALQAHWMQGTERTTFSVYSWLISIHCGSNVEFFARP